MIGFAGAKRACGISRLSFLTFQTSSNQLDREIDTIQAQLKQEITETKSELKQEITETKSELKQEITEIKSELKQEMSDIRGDIRTIDARLKNVETSIQKIPEISETFGELKNWRQIALIIIAAIFGWFVRSGKL